MRGVQVLLDTQINAFRIDFRLYIIGVCMRLNDKQLAAWRTTRRRGKRRFIVVEWMVYWGLPTGMMWSVAMTILERGFSNILSESFVIQSLIASILFPVGGFFAGLWIWTRSERAYLEQIRTNQTTRHSKVIGQT